MTDRRHKWKIKFTDFYVVAVLTIILLSFFLSGFAQQPLTISLAGEWKFTTDPSDKGITEKWFLQSYPETIRLPGSMAENNKGDAVTLQTQWTGSIYDSSWYFNPRMAKYRQPDNLKFPFWLTPAKHYVGAAWYRKEVTIPQNTGNRRWVLYLERAHTETMAWVDGKPAGMQNTMVAAQEFDATGMLPPGKHTITLRIDNRIKAINVGQDSHSLTDHTQGNWNGVTGNLCLRAGATTWLDDVQVYPDVTHKIARVVCTVRDQSTRSSYCMLAYGNEPRGRQVEYLTGFVNYWRARDHRRLYTGASVGGSWPVIPANEYMIRGGARGLDWARRPESQSDYRKEIEQFKVPFVAHEMGQ